jgi:CBS domain-containing protein
MKHYIESFAKPVLTVPPHETLASVAGIMSRRNVGAVVVTEHHHPVGIITDRDLALALALGGGATTPQTPVVQVMTSPVETVLASDGVFEVTQTMRERNVRRLVVVDREGDILGIVTLDDLLRLLSKELSNLVSAIAPAEMRAH